MLNANTDGKTYTSVTAAISTLDSNIGNLTMTSAQAYYSQGTKVNVTAALDKFSSLFGPMNFNEAGAHYINNDANVSSALMIFDSNLWRIDQNFDAMLRNVGFRKVGDEFTTTIDWSDSSYSEGTTIVTAIKDLDDRVLTLEGKNPAGQSLAAFSNMSEYGYGDGGDVGFHVFGTGGNAGGEGSRGSSGGSRARRPDSDQYKTGAGRRERDRGQR